jgi:rhamnulose-1-phosphate aldolase/alcohol dehydrogenase
MNRFKGVGSRSADPEAAQQTGNRSIDPETTWQNRTSMTNTPVSPVSELVARSNRLGADPRNTNYAGGNTSAKGSVIDPVTQGPVELLWVKGSGGDLGTLTEAGLSVLRLDRLRALVAVYPGVEREDEMVAAFDFCLHGKGGAAPSIDTAMHGLVTARHVDHLHPDSGIALATAADGEALTKECFGARVVWVPWRRPGFQLGLDIAAIQEASPQAIGCILGGHGITAWASSGEQCEANSLEIIAKAEAFLAERGRTDPLGAVVAGFEALPEAERHARAAALAPVIRGLVSTDKPQVGAYSDADVVLDFCARERLATLAARGTSCPDHFLRTKVRPMVLDLPATAPIEDVVARLHELHAAYREDYAAYYARHATVQSPPMRGADPAVVLVPGVGMFSFGANAQTARVAGEFYLNAINVIRGAEAVSTYAPIDESEKFRIEYWALEEAKLARLPRPKPLATRVALVTGAGSGIGRAIAHRLAAEGACVVVADLDGQAAATVAAEIAAATMALKPSDVAIPVTANVTDAGQVAAAFAAGALAFGGVDLVVNNAGLSISKPLLETTEADWDLQHDVMAKGSFLVSREAARMMIAQQLGGDIVYISSKNAVVAGPNNIAYSATKADQAHQVRLLAAELGEHQIRVNGINPDGVVRGSGIFAKGWGAQRAAVYGVSEDRLGEYYAQRTILKREVLPEHVANAVFALTAGDLSHTTGLHIPVDAGVAAAFLR